MCRNKKRRRIQDIRNLMSYSKMIKLNSRKMTRKLCRKSLRQLKFNHRQRNLSHLSVRVAYLGISKNRMIPWCRVLHPRAPCLSWTWKMPFWARWKLVFKSKFAVLLKTKQKYTSLKMTEMMTPSLRLIPMIKKNRWKLSRSIVHWSNLIYTILERKIQKIRYLHFW